MGKMGSLRHWDEPEVCKVPDIHSVLQHGTAASNNSIDNGQVQYKTFL